jgi:hypothetical protein
MRTLTYTFALIGITYVSLTVLGAVFKAIGIN